MQTEYDIIIIGGGSAGCVLANRLSTEGPGGRKYRVLVVEAGESSLNVLFSYLPGAFGQMFHDERWDYNYFTVPQKGCHGRKMFQPRTYISSLTHKSSATLLCLFFPLWEADEISSALRFVICGRADGRRKDAWRV